MDGGDLLFDLPPSKTRRSSRQSRPAAMPRPHPIRDAIMAFLAEPRTAKEVALHIERKTSTATGHLWAMHRKALIVRLSWGVWIRRDQCENPPDQARINRPNAAQDRLMAHLAEPKTLPELEKLTKRRTDVLLTMLKKMMSRGEIGRRPDGRFTVVR